MKFERWHCLARVLNLIVVTLLSSASMAQAQTTVGVITKDVPLLLVPEPGRQPLLILERGVSVEVHRREGAWVNVTVAGSQFGRRTGYVDARSIEVRPAGTEVPRVTAASVIPPASSQQASNITPVQQNGSAATPQPVASGAGHVDARPPAPVLRASERPHVFIAAAETVDGSNSRDKAKQVDFGSSLSAALMKKKVPVTIVTDASKAHWIVTSTSSQHEDSTGTKVAKIAFAGVFAGGFTKFEGTVQVIDNTSSAVVFAYNVKKGNFQSAAEAFAKHFNTFLKDR